MRTLIAITASLFAAGSAQAFELTQLPDEYEATTGANLGLNNVGAAANDPHASIRVNPALLAGEKAYSVQGGYHWPTEGREFYQLAVVDSKTSAVAAGVSYTSFMDDYEKPMKQQMVDPDKKVEVDSPIVRRGVLGLASNFGNVQGGIGATYVEANRLVNSTSDKDRENSRIKGIGLNLGIGAALLPALKVGASVENMSNRKIADYEPRTIRAGAAYAFAPKVTGYLDFRQRDRIDQIEGGSVDLDKPAEQAKKDAKEKEDLLSRPEQMIFAALSAQVYDFFRLMGSFGQAISDDRRSLSGGVAVVNKGMSLAYTAARSNMKTQAAHQAVSLGLDLAF